MRATELKPGQAGVTSDGRIVVAREQAGGGMGSRERWVYCMDCEGRFHADYLANQFTVDITLLGPVTKLDDLPDKVGRYEIGYGGSVYTSKTGPMVYLSSVMEALEGRCLVRDSEEREDKQLRAAYCQCSQSDKCPLGPKPGMSMMCTAKELREALIKVTADRDELHATGRELEGRAMLAEHQRDTLTARVAELERTLRRCASVTNPKSIHREYQLDDVDELVSDYVAELECKAAQAEAELAGLREQQTLGEELTEDAFMAMDKRDWVIMDCDGDIEPGFRGDYVWDGLAKFYKLAKPVLPSPVEEVPEVPLEMPKWLIPSGAQGIVCYRGNTGAKPSGPYGVVLSRWENEDRWNVYWFGSEAIHFVTSEELRTSGWRIYSLPVRHPDGTIAPIEPTAELVAALKGEGESCS